MEIALQQPTAAVNGWTTEPIAHYEGWDEAHTSDLLAELYQEEAPKALWHGNRAFLDHFEKAGELLLEVIRPLVSKLNFLTGLNTERTYQLILSSPLWRENAEVFNWSSEELKDLVLENAHFSKCVYRRTSPGKSISIDTPLDKGRVYETEGRDTYSVETDDKGRVIDSYANILAYLSRWREHGHMFFYDTFTDTRYHGVLGGDERELAIKDGIITQDMQELLERGVFKKVSLSAVDRAMSKLAYLNKYDSVQQHLLGLEWDGKHRVTKLFTRYFGAEENEYTDAVSNYLMTALVGRIMVPGIKADIVPILSGAMGLKKTSAIEALAGPGLSATIRLDESDSDKLTRLMKGKVLLELGEFQPGRSKKGIKALREFITATVERWVPKYIEGAVEYKRRCIMIATINEIEILNDPEGERRYAPVRVTRSFDIDGLNRDRDQLWAEALVMFNEDRAKGGFGVMFQDAERLAQHEHAKFKVTDAWDEILMRFAKSLMPEMPSSGRKVNKPKRWGEAGFSPFEAATRALSFKSRDISFQVEDRIKARLRTLGFEQRQVMRGGTREMRWVFPKNTILKGAPKPFRDQDQFTDFVDEENEEQPQEQTKMDLEDAA